MGFFGGNPNEKKLSFALGGYVFKSDEKYISYQSIYGKRFRVRKSDVESVSLDQGKMGQNVIKLNGKGTTLATIELPAMWAEKAQEFIQDEVEK